MATVSARGVIGSTWGAALLPVVLVGLLAGVFLWLDPVASLRPVPPAESIAVERTVFTEGGLELHVRNDGPDPVTVAQVLIDDAYWAFSMDDRGLGRLESAEIEITYPWETGLPLNVTLLTSTGVRIDHEIEAAALTPEPDAGTWMAYALLGLYVGVIPVAIGLLWFGALKRASQRWIGFFLAFTVGLLAFLLVDTVEEGLELAGQTAGALNGLGLFAIGALGAVIALFYVEDRTRQTGSRARRGLVLAYLIAAGIGLHNLGEGLAVGTALAAGEVALGTFLILGFALHNTTEGLAIVAPLGSERERPAMKHFVGLGALAGAPTIAGAWLGGFAFSHAWSALAFGVAAGAIAQVIWTIGRAPSHEARLTSAPGAAGFVAGLVFMYATGLLTV